jgi:hypothetical protein
MKIFRNFEGRRIRLTEERRHHILEHPELSGLERAVGETLADPETVVQSLSDEDAQLYYRHYVGTPVGDKFMCVVVKVSEADAFVITAYLTDRVKKGKQIWPSET